MNRWPLQKNCDTYYGNPRGKDGGPSVKWESANLTSIKPPYRMTYAGKAISGIRVHKKCADSLLRVLNAIWDSDRIDDDLILSLATDTEKRKQPEGRADATPAMVRERVPEAKATWLGKITSNLTAAGSAVGAGVAAAWDKLGDAKGYLEPIKDFVGDVPLWLWLVALASGAFILSRQFRKGEVAVTEAFQEGARR